MPYRIHPFWRHLRGPPSPPAPVPLYRKKSTESKTPLRNAPHASRGRRIRDGLRPLPPTPIKTKLATQLSLTLRDPAALLVRSPGKPYHTTFLTVAGIPRRFSSVPPENLVTQLSSPWLHPAGLLVRSGLSTPGPRRRVFSRILRFAPRPGNQAGNQAGEPSKTQPPQGLSPLTLHCLLHDFV